MCCAALTLTKYSRSACNTNTHAPQVKIIASEARAAGRVRRAECPLFGNGGFAGAVRISLALAHPGALSASPPSDWVVRWRWRWRVTRPIEWVLIGNTHIKRWWIIQHGMAMFGRTIDERRAIWINGIHSKPFWQAFRVWAGCIYIPSTSNYGANDKPLSSFWSTKLSSGDARFSSCECGLRDNPHRNTYKVES